MEVRVYEVLLEFNHGLRHSLESLDIVEKLELAAPDYVNKARTKLSELCADVNNHSTSKIACREPEEGNHFYRIRRKRKKTEEDPNDIYLDVKAREWLRRERGLPPRAVLLPWTQADDDRILAMQKAAAPPFPPQPEQCQTTGDAKQEGPEGGGGT
jgi:hypothetical protein